MKNTIIVILIILLLISGAFSWQPAYKLINKHFNGVEPYKIHIDSILIAKRDVEELKKKDREIIAKITQDGIRRTRDSISHQKEISRLKRNAAHVDFTKSTSDELDSIRSSLFGNSGSDTLVTMPIDQARESLAAVAREPIKDSTINVLEFRVWNLEGDLIRQEEAFKQRILGFSGVVDKQGIQIRNLEAINKKQDEDYRLEKLKGWGKGLVGLLAGFGIGKVLD